jgi:uncharacterized protein YndB with AHSA1/START domain
MSDHGEVLESGAVRFVRTLPGPIERVWAFLTESEKRRRWLASGGMELRPGGRMELNFLHKELAGEDVPERHRDMESGHHSTGEVVEATPPTRLVFLWHEDDGGATEVTFELTALGGPDDRVRLELTHRNLASRKDMISVASGWHAHLNVLEDVLAGRPPRPFWPAHEAAEKEYAGRIR